MMELHRRESLEVLVPHRFYAFFGLQELRSHY